MEKSKEEEKYVPNEVFKFRCSLKWELSDDDMYVYTKPFPDVYENDESKGDKYEDEENLVISKYFTKEKIEELKDKFIKRIQASDNPFDINCVDRDGNWYVTKDELFDIDN